MMFVRVTIAAVCLFLLAGLPASVLAQDKNALKAGGAEVRLSVDTDTEALRKAHAAYLVNGALQLERTVAEPAPPVRQRSTPGWIQSIGQFLADIAGALGPLFRILVYIVVAVIVALLIWFIAGEALNLRSAGLFRRRQKKEDDIIPDLRPDKAAARSLLEEADALARNGKFAEAVHLLLFRSIEDIQTRQSGSVSRDLTAREIGRLETLPERPRKALSPIIQIVERSFFGGRDVDEGGWQEARASYEDFAFGAAWS